MQESDAHESTPSAPDDGTASAPSEAAPSAAGEAAGSAAGAEATAPAPSEPSPPATTGPAAEPRRCRLRFTGTGEEYFGIWIVNLLLTIVTLGIYSAWAKVRKMQYFYRNTQLDRSGFEYHGNPVAILKGRLLAAGLLIAYNVALKTLGAVALIVVLAVIAAVPWLLTQSYRFRLRNSSYRGLRFRFEGPVSEAYLFIGLPMILMLAPSALIQSGVAGDPQHSDPMFGIFIGGLYLMLAVLWPYLHFSFKRWQHGNAFYGTARGRFAARPGEFYRAYGAAWGIALFCGILAGIVAPRIFGVAGSSTGGSFARGFGFVLVAIPFYLVAIWVGSIVTARIQNAAWSGTRIEGVAFAGDMRAGRLMGITLGNVVMIVLSLGLLIPFAVMRSMKYKIESIEVLDADALAQFVGDDAGSSVGALGEGAVDVMDFDFGL
ncbi:MAG TPA: YjgN family protein [Burkholderiaceae bacterium]|jgi:uncharacterized membrane protein YjgN (DUF898 family)|nr:YjgN family protein [Burkholderiaceae bacterium]